MTDFQFQVKLKSCLHKVGYKLEYELLKTSVSLGIADNTICLLDNESLRNL